MLDLFGFTSCVVRVIRSNISDSFLSKIMDLSALDASSSSLSGVAAIVFWKV
jgi:hypothetical protein